jgi:hypothetical protein
MRGNSTGPPPIRRRPCPSRARHAPAYWVWGARSISSGRRKVPRGPPFHSRKQRSPPCAGDREGYRMRGRIRIAAVGPVGAAGGVRTVVGGRRAGEPVERAGRRRLCVARPQFGGEPCQSGRRACPRRARGRAERDQCPHRGVLGPNPADHLDGGRGTGRAHAHLPGPHRLARSVVQPNQPPTGCPMRRPERSTPSGRTADRHRARPSGPPPFPLRSRGPARRLPMEDATASRQDRQPKGQ